MFRNLRFLGLRAELPSTLYNVNTILRHLSDDVGSNLDIRIPQRIERNPTDILKALEQTLQRDPTAFHYKYPDDPYFAPHSATDKRSIALSLESGKKSAQWIVNNNPNFFKEKISEPFIQAFTPKIVYNETTDVTEAILVKVIREKNVLDAIEVYNLLNAKSTDISNETKQLLLELVCFYNNGEEEHEQDLELKWFLRTQKKQFLNTWKDDGFAETLFQSMDPDDPLACSTMIQGRLKFNEIDKGFELFDFARQKDMTLSISAYNELIAHVNGIKENGKERWEFIEILLNDLESKSIQPNLYTLNAVLESLHLIKNWHGSLECALKTVKEFLKLGISPSLGSYYYLSVIFKNTNYKNPVSVERFLEGIVNVLIESKLEIQHPSDMLFFERIMDICAVYLQNWCLASLLNTLLEANDNVKFIGNNKALNKYYGNYITLLFEKMPVQSAMKAYRALVPVVYSPELRVIQAILKVLFRQNSYESLNEIWKDIIQLKLDHNDVLVNLVEMFVADEEEKSDEASRFFSEVSTVLLKRMEITDDRNKFKMPVTGKLVSNMMIGFVKIRDFHNASSVFKNVADGVFSVSFSHTAVKFFFDFCASLEKFPQLLDCLRYASMKNHPEISEMAGSALVHSSKLNDGDVKWLHSLVNGTRQNEPSCKTKDII